MEFLSRDGLHLSKAGNDQLSKILTSSLGSKPEANMCNPMASEQFWETSYNKQKMTFTGEIEDKELEILVDTGSFVTLMGKKVADEAGLTLTETNLKEIVGIALHNHWLDFGQ